MVSTKEWYTTAFNRNQQRGAANYAFIATQLSSAFILLSFFYT